jgi:hypothetical protein
MATQAKETKTSSASFPAAARDSEKSLCGFWKVGHASFHKNPQIAITVK